MGSLHVVLATRALALARARQCSRRETRTIERRERSYQQRNVHSGEMQVPDCAGKRSFWPAPALEDNIVGRPHRLFSTSLAVVVETSDKRDMHGLLYRIFAALKFDGAKIGESPTLTMPQEFLYTEAKEQATLNS